MTYKERAADLYRKMEEGQLMEAFEAYYHEDVVVAEPTGETRQGKAAQRKAIEEWAASVEEMHGGATEFVTSDEENAVTMVQSFTDVTKDGQRMAFREVAVQQWKDGQIIREDFFYFIPAEIQQQMAASQAASN